MESLNDTLNKYKFPIALSLVGIVLILGGAFSSGLTTSKSKVLAESAATRTPSYSQENSALTSDGQIKIDLAGAVNNPGVYSFYPGDRVEDAIKKAGGLKETANQDFVSKDLNLSQKLSDGQKIYVPSEGEMGGGVSQNGDGKVSLNLGSESELESLSGVGPATAQKIIDARPYGSIEDLITKKIVSKSVFSKISDQLNLN